MRTQPTDQAVLAAYRYFNPYHYEGDHSNSWTDLLTDYRLKRDNPCALYHHDAVAAGSFRTWLVNEASSCAFEKLHDL